MYFAVELVDGRFEIATCQGTTPTTAWFNVGKFPSEVDWVCGPHKTRGAAYRAIGKRQDERDADTAELAEAAGVPA